MNRAVLGLVIEQPSYGYDIYKRLERRYGRLLQIGNSHVYAALNSLQKQGLIESGSRVEPSERQPRPLYHATHAGREQHLRWLSEMVRDDQTRIELTVRMLSTADVDQLREVVDRYIDECLDAIPDLPPADAGGEENPLATLILELVLEERRLAAEAQMAWSAYAKQRIRERFG